MTKKKNNNVKIQKKENKNGEKKSKNNEKTFFIVGGLVLLVAIAVGLFLFFSVKNYTITFNTDDGSNVANIVAKENTIVTLPINTTKDGYVFSGWTDEKGTPVNAKIKLTRNTTLTAIWISEEAETITITFDSAGGTKVNSIILEKGSELLLPENPEKSGYTFICWVDKNETPIYDKALLSEDTSLTATWKKDSASSSETSTISATSISLNNNSVAMIVNNTATLTATVSPSNTTNKTVVWYSSDESVVTVDKNGRLKAVGLGKATITVKTSNGKTATATVTSDVKSLSISLSKSAISYYGSKTATATVNVDTNGYALKSEDLDINASTRIGKTGAAKYTIDKNIVTITALTTGNAGSVIVTAKVGNKTETKTVFVEKKLTLSEGSSNTATCNTNTWVCSFSGESTLHLTSNINVTWSYNSQSNVVANSASTSNSLIIYLNNVKQTGLPIEVSTAGGQSQSIIVNAPGK